MTGKHRKRKDPSKMTEKELVEFEQELKDEVDFPSKTGELKNGEGKEHQKGRK